MHPAGLSEEIFEQLRRICESSIDCCCPLDDNDLSILGVDFETAFSIRSQLLNRRGINVWVQVWNNCLNFLFYYFQILILAHSAKIRFPCSPRYALLRNTMGFWKRYCYIGSSSCISSFSFREASNRDYNWLSQVESWRVCKEAKFNFELKTESSAFGGSECRLWLFTSCWSGT